MERQQPYLDWLAHVQDSFTQRSTTFYALILSFVIIIATTVLYIIVRRSSRLKRAVLIMGQCDSGKTALYLRLLNNVNKLTYTSIKENEGSYVTQTSKKTLKIVDVPGHERLRTKFLSRFIPLARGIIFVVDSSTFQKDITDVVEYMYTILVENNVSRSVSRILVACNKQDCDFAKSKSAICAQMEKELTTIRTTKTGSLHSLDSSSVTTFIGKKNKNFEFADILPIRVDFEECCIMGENDKLTNVTPIETWLDSL